MAKKEIKTDLWVYELLKQAGIDLDPQGSSIIEINNALKTASKKGTGKTGFPEYVGVVKDYLIVIEDKADLAKHIQKNEKGVISQISKDVTNYAVNGALFYGMHLARTTQYKKIFAIGVSGDEHKHRISPLYIDETEYYRELPDIESFISFNETNIDEYYTHEVLKESTDIEKETAELLKDAEILHEDLRNYGNLLDTEKPLVVSGIMLALREIEYGNFHIDNLSGDSVETDGKKIYNAIKSNLDRANVAPEVKKDKILSQFSFIKDTVTLNKKQDIPDASGKKLAKTPLKHFAEFLYSKFYKVIRFGKSPEDYIGRFYGEFMSYSGGDGQTLGIILTPKHITQLFCELLDIQVDDVVLDPCCGTGGFLIAALYNMLKKVDLQTDLDQSQKDALKKNIRQKQLHGIELRPNMFTIATTNMILRGDGKSNLINGDFLSEKAGKLQLKSPTKGMMNPPYSQGSKANPGLYELSFTEHLLDSLVEGAKCAVIIPQSSLTGKTKEEQSLKANIYKKHTLEGVISLNKDTFYGVGTITCIAIFTAGEPHPANKVCKFINFENDGYRVAPHVGLIATEAAKDKKQHLLDVWFDRIKADNKFCVYSTVEPEDEWLYGFYYYNDEIPTEVDFEKVIGDYLTFEFSMIMQNREYLFEDERLKHSRSSCKTAVDELASHNWKNFFIDDIFTISPGKRLVAKDMTEGLRPFIGAADSNNGITNFVSDSNESLDKNVLGVNYDGNGMVISFYHPYECIFTDSVKRFHLKHHTDNKYILLFMKIAILQQKAKYNYGYKFNGTRMARQIISLPVTDEGEPDYQYMEQYVKSLFAKKLAQYIEFAKKYHSAARKTYCTNGNS